MLFNGVLSGAEIALVSLRGSRLDVLIQAGSRRARAVKRLRGDPERFLATVQIGITVVGAVAGAFGGATFAADLQPLLQRVPLLREHAASLSLAIVVVLISYLSLVLGELVPKSLALRFAERYALLIGPPLLWLSWIARPVVWFLTASSNVLLRLFGDRTTFTEARLSAEEIREVVEQAARVGSVHPGAGEIASRALDFADLSVAQVMVPRGRVAALPLGASLDEVRRLLLEKGHTRMPVYDGQLDNVVGYVNIKDVVALALERPLSLLKEILRPAYFVAGTMLAVNLLNEMKRRRLQFAVVVDELGAVSGIVTLEDLVEELVGEIFSEHDAPPPEAIRREADDTYLVEAGMPVHEVNRGLDLDLPLSDRWSTLGGLCLELAGRIPAVGDRIDAPGAVLEVVSASPRQVLAVRVHRRPPPPADGDAGGGESSTKEG